MSTNELEIRKAPIAKAVAVALTLGVAASAVSLSASANPFQLNSLDGGYMQIAMEGSCGGEKAKEGSCGGEKAKEKGKEASCGEAKCGGAA